jgi:signal transduction histidine kinase
MSDLPVEQGVSHFQKFTFVIAIFAALGASVGNFHTWFLKRDVWFFYDGINSSVLFLLYVPVLVLHIQKRFVASGLLFLWATFVCIGISLVVSPKETALPVACSTFVVLNALPGFLLPGGGRSLRWVVGSSIWFLCLLFVRFWLRDFDVVHLPRDWFMLISIPPASFLVAGYLAHRSTSDLRTALEGEQLAREEAEAASQAKTMFLATVSHELRTPLNAIIGYSEMLSEEAEDCPDLLLINSTPELERIQLSARHLLHLINNILDVSRLDVGQIDLLLEPLRVDELLDEVQAITEPLVGRQENKLIVIGSGEPLWVKGDRLRLIQILVNLVANAAKFTQNGTITCRLRCLEEGGCAVDVEDTGVGIPEDVLPTIFERFVQVDSSYTRQHDGVGLGLAISHHLCELMGYELSVSSTLGVGTIFSLTIPASCRVDAPSSDGARSPA